MRKISFLSIFAILVMGIAGAAFAGPKCGSSSKAADSSACSQAQMKECCAKAAVSGTACCGQDAAALKAAFIDQKALEAATADMHKCCATAVVDGKGCCGMDAESLKTKHAVSVEAHKANLVALGSMHECCAVAVEGGKGCCGMSADELKTAHKTAVENARKIAG